MSSEQLLEVWKSGINRFLSLGETYGVDPLIFGAIYIGAIPFFTFCVGWIIRNIRTKRSIIIPSLLAGCCFVSSYVYLIVVGKNVPLWVYIFIVGLLLFGVWSTWKKILSGIGK